MSEQPLFDMQPRQLRKGDRVTVLTIWGDEPGVVSRAVPDTYYHSLVEVVLERGDTITISTNRVKKA